MIRLELRILNNQLKYISKCMEMNSVTQAAKGDQYKHNITSKQNSHVNKSLPQAVNEQQSSSSSFTPKKFVHFRTNTCIIHQTKHLIHTN